MSDWRNSFFQEPILEERLEEIGFVQEGDSYLFEEELGDLGLTLKLTWLIQEKKMFIELWDPFSQSDYNLAFLESSRGNFVGQVREQVQKLLLDLEQKLTKEKTVFDGQAEHLLERIRNRWDWELEFLWKDQPKAAVLRYGPKHTWFALIQEIPWSKLIREKEGNVSVLTVKSDRVAQLLAEKKAYPGYHMNKKYWLSFPLDGSLALESLEDYLIESYRLIGGDLSLERKPMKILLPTAKELNLTGDFLETQNLSETSQSVLASLAKVTDWARFYKLKENKATQEEARIQSLLDGTAKTKPALQLFNGLMYRQMEREDLANPLWEQVYITSSLYGCVPILTPMAPHRLDFQVPLQVEGQSLQQFWRDSYDEAIGDTQVLSLLSSEFEQVFSKAVRENFVRIEFKEKKNGSLKTHSTISKKGRGLLITHLVNHPITNLEELKQAQFAGFSYQEEGSDDKTWLFVREP